MLVVLLIALATLSPSVATCPPDAPESQCLADPCAAAACSGACVVDKCGGCFALCSCVTQYDCAKGEDCAQGVCVPSVARPNADAVTYIHILNGFQLFNLSQSYGVDMTFGPSPVAGRTLVTVSFWDTDGDGLLDICTNATCETRCGLDASMNPFSYAQLLAVGTQEGGMTCSIHQINSDTFYVDPSVSSSFRCLNPADCAGGPALPASSPAVAASSSSSSLAEALASNSNAADADPVSFLHVLQGFSIFNLSGSYGVDLTFSESPVAGRVLVTVSFWDTDGDAYLAICSDPTCVANCTLDAGMNPMTGARLLDVTGEHGLTCVSHTVNKNTFYINPSVTAAAAPSAPAAVAAPDTDPTSYIHILQGFTVVNVSGTYGVDMTFGVSPLPGRTLVTVAFWDTDGDGLFDICSDASCAQRCTMDASMNPFSGALLLAEGKEYGVKCSVRQMTADTFYVDPAVVLTAEADLATN